MQLFLFMTKEGKDVSKTGVELPRGLRPSEAIGFMELRQFTLGVELLDFLEDALQTARLSKRKEDVLKRIRMDRLHVRHLRLCPCIQEATSMLAVDPECRHRS